MNRCTFALVHYSILLSNIFPPFLAQPAGIVLDNSVIGDPKIDCTGEQVGITFSTQRPFTGRVFVQGYSAQRDCVMSGVDRPPGLSLGLSQCGVQRSRQLSPPGMIVYTTVIISFHAIFVTKLDRAYRISCHYMEAGRTVTADLDVSMLSTAAMTSAPAMPECRYEILLGGPTGQPARYVRVGEQIYHKWTCDSKDSAYCMRVHSCSADDGQGSESFMVVDRQGCATDRFVLQNLEYLTDLTAGQETHVFKFADKASLFFSCQIELLSKASESANCVSARPNCTELSTVGPVPTPAVTSVAVSVGLTSATQTAAPAPTVPRDIRRVARDVNESMFTGEDDLRVLGDMDLLRQHLTIFDLDDAANDDALVGTNRRGQSLDSDRYSVSNTVGLIGPICVSPIGFGFALFGLLAIFLIALSTAIRYALPIDRLAYAYDSRTIISTDCNPQNLPRYFSFRSK